MNVTSPVSTADSGNAGASRASLTANFEDFLLLLTKQLEQQDPLSPMDSEKFTEQLVQFATVEQASRTNERLDTLIDTIRTGQLLTAAGYVGKQVEFAGDRLFLGETGEATIAYSLPRTARSAQMRILGADGREIVARAVPADAGRHVVTWDGRDARGRQSPPGEYRLVVDATDATGAAVPVELRSIAVVDAIYAEGDALLLSAGGVRYPASAAVAVRAAPAGS